MSGSLKSRNTCFILWACAYKLGVRHYLTVFKSSGSTHRLYFLHNKTVLDTAHFKGKFTIFLLYSVDST